MNRLAVIAGGWHFPRHFYESLSRQLALVPDDWTVDLFVVTHRSPEEPIVRTEKQAFLDGDAPLVDLDRTLYASYPATGDLVELGWEVLPAPNTVGDFEFFNQWLERADWQRYDLFLNCHDDLLFTRDDFLAHVLSGAAPLHRHAEPDLLRGNAEWLLLSNCSDPGERHYVRGSCTFFRRALLDQLGGRIDLGPVMLTREGQVETPYEDGLNPLRSWNSTIIPLQRFLADHDFVDRMLYLSPYYRVSRYCIECERGFVHWAHWNPVSFQEGMRAYGHAPEPTDSASALETSP